MTIPVEFFFPETIEGRMETIRSIRANFDVAAQGLLEEAAAELTETLASKGMRQHFEVGQGIIDVEARPALGETKHLEQKNCYFIRSGTSEKQISVVQHGNEELYGAALIKGAFLDWNLQNIAGSITTAPENREQDKRRIIDAMLRVYSMNKI